MSDSDPSQPEPLDELFATGPAAIEPARSLTLPGVVPEDAAAPRRSAPPVVVRMQAAGRPDERIRRLSAPAWATLSCLTVCVAYYLVMIAQGVHPLLPDAGDLLKWGANYAPLTWNGEAWRLITCMFMHAGAIHLAVNMWALWSAGRYLERLVGTVGFLIIYFSAGIVGSLASLWWNGSIVSVGASGAIFGVLGAFASFIWNRSDSFPPAAHSQLRRSLVSCIGLNLLLGASIPGIDQAAHVGGLLSGLLLGALLSQRLDQRSLERRWRKNLVAGLVAAVGLGAAVIWHPPAPPDLQYESALYIESVRPLLTRVGEILKAYEAKQMTPKQLVTSMKTEILPPWRELREHFDSLANVPQRSREDVHQIQMDLKLREESWLALIAGMQKGDKTQFESFENKSKQAAQIELRLLPKLRNDN